jgi:hypothetical protein
MSTSEGYTDFVYRVRGEAQRRTAMNKFRKLGLISYNAHIKVNSALLDAVLRDKPELGEDE